MRDRRDTEITAGLRVAYSARLGSTGHALYTGVVKETDMLVRGPWSRPTVRIVADHSGKTAEREASEVLVLD